MIKQIRNEALLEHYHVENFPYNSFEMSKICNLLSSSGSCKIFSIKYNKIIILKKITFSQKYTLENFIDDHSENIFIHRDPRYLQNIETYKLNKSSDIYSIGILLWEISSGTIPFKTETPYNYYLLNEIIHGKREVAVSGAPINYIKSYNKCWKNDSNQRPNIFNNLNNIDYNNEEIFIEYVKENENKVIELLNKGLNKNNDQFNTLESNLLNITNSFSQVSIRKYNNINSDQYFLYNLNQLLITQFNIQGVSEYTTNSIIHSIKKYMDDYNKNLVEILRQYYNHQCSYYYTSIIGFFYEYGIGTIVDYYKAFNMYDNL
ncbi:calmodulin-dependent protein kinase [Gigaspora margarita]|uniref:Calmodulin-dependent protein kinase n=1 Tax=Gigaspora margarita TaxID=4874 RepID=A0A8H4EPB2_GIGMA|nr:calmodulin-dependent protein kinase [Gigaspora margarita]